jgi:hypothetical protein
MYTFVSQTLNILYFEMEGVLFWLVSANPTSTKAGVELFNQLIHFSTLLPGATGSIIGG